MTTTAYEDVDFAETREYCLAADVTSQAAGLAEIELEPRVVDDGGGYTEEDLAVIVVEHPDRERLVAWMTFASPVLQNLGGESEGDGALAIGGAGDRIRASIGGNFPLAGDFAGTLGGDAVTLPTDWAPLAQALAADADGADPFLWDLHDDRSTFAPHVFGSGCSGAAGGPVEAVDNCTGGGLLGPFSTIAGLTGSAALGPFDLTRLDGTSLGDGKVDADDMPLPPGRVELTIAAGGVGSLTAVSKAAAYSRDGTGAEIPSNLYAPFYSATIAGFVEPYPFWEPFLVTHRSGSNACKDPRGSPYAFPAGARVVSVNTDEHGEALVHFAPGDGLVLSPDAQGRCDLGLYGSASPASVSMVDAQAHYPQPVAGTPSPGSNGLSFAREGEQAGSSLDCIPKGSFTWACFHRISGPDGEPLPGAEVRISQEGAARLLPSSILIGGFDSRGQTVVNADPDERWAVLRTNAEGTVGVEVAKTLPGPFEVLSEEVGTRNGGFGVSRSVTVAPSVALAITGVGELADPVGRYERFEATIALSEPFPNPFNPDQIAVDVSFTSPSGRVQTVPAFWYLPFTVSGSPSSEQYEPAGVTGWRVRFAPSETGTYTYAVNARAGSRNATPVQGSFEVQPTSRPGFVRVDSRNGRYLRYDSGDPYVPVGHNVAFEDGNPPLSGTGYYSAAFQSLDTAGENWTRVWMTDFNGSALEWGSGHYTGFYSGAGRYSLASAWRLDRILELAEQHGISLQLVLNDHGQFSTWVNGRWAPRCDAGDTPPCQPGDAGFDPGNGYSSANGGPVDVGTPQAFFTDPASRALFKQRLRYLVARYGAFTSLLAWELFNEVQFVGTSAVNPTGDAGLRAAIVDWHAAMSSYLAGLDAYDHLVTTSSWDPGATAGLWSLPGIDVVQIHTYSSPPSAKSAEIRDIVSQAKSAFGKPVIVGEFGLGSGDPEAGFDPGSFSGSNADRQHLVEGTHLHNGAWAAALSESAAGYWWWGNYIAADAAKGRVAPAFPLNQRHVPPLVSYLAGEDWAPLGLETAPLSASTGTEAVGVSSATRAYVWVHDALNEFGTGAAPGDLAGRTITGASVSIGGIADGRYRIRAFDTWGAGGVTATLFANATGSTLTVPLPTFTRDLALKIDPVADTDGDGIADDVDTSPDAPSAGFSDGAGTTGTIVATDGLTVSIVDALPGGVTITTSGLGGPATISACTGFTVTIAAGSSITLTCGSITIAVSEGTATIALGGGLATLTIPAGAAARASIAPDGSYSVVSLAGSVTLVVDGVATTIAPGPAVTVQTWNFEGFFAPVEPPPALNKANAGQAIPLKWRLTDAFGAPVTSLTTARLHVTTHACTLGTTANLPTETTNGTLKHKGRGNYELVWKTPKSYAGSCKVLHLDVGDGVTHTALFAFR